jgi:hypothetical protein
MELKIRISPIFPQDRRKAGTFTGTDKLDQDDRLLDFIGQSGRFSQSSLAVWKSPCAKPN